MRTGWAGRREVVEVACTLDIAVTPETFHAYAVPEAIDIHPGDVVLVHDAPAHVAFGEHIVRETRASVARAGLLTRVWTRLRGFTELTDLYEVGFEARP